MMRNFGNTQRDSSVTTSSSNFTISTGRISTNRANMN